jgi:hypothetical protein
LQIDALTRHGIPKKHIFLDKRSGAKTERPGLTRHADKSLEIDDICNTLRISRSTFYRYVRM